MSHLRWSGLALVSVLVGCAGGPRPETIDACKRLLEQEALHQTVFGIGTELDRFVWGWEKPTEARVQFEVVINVVETLGTINALFVRDNLGAWSLANAQLVQTVKFEVLPHKEEDPRFIKHRAGDWDFYPHPNQLGAAWFSCGRSAAPDAAAEP